MPFELVDDIILVGQRLLIFEAKYEITGWNGSSSDDAAGSADAGADGASDEGNGG